MCGYPWTLGWEVPPCEPATGKGLLFLPRRGSCNNSIFGKTSWNHCWTYFYKWFKIQKYLFHIIWQKGKDLIIANTLSRAPQLFTEPNNIEEYEVHSVQNLPISDIRLAELREETSKDLLLQMVQKYVN